VLTPNTVLASKEFEVAATELARVGRFLAERGWSPATSSNYSVRLSKELQAMTRTGIDKYNMSPSDVIVVNNKGDVVGPVTARSSAETLIHTAIYNKRPNANAILHTHSPRNTRLSLKFLNEGQISFNGYEMQKGLQGIDTHHCHVTLPILPNSQDMVKFSSDVESLLDAHPDIHGFLIAGHGLYTWADNLQITKRQVESFEFLFECLTLEIAGI
jgi:methylthioribulose-1-phosphate dehydratase